MKRNINSNCNSGKRNRGLAYRRRMKHKKEKRRRDIIKVSGCYFHGGWLEREYINGIYMIIGTYIKYPSDSNAQQFLKRVSNKKVRRYRGEIHKGSLYKKLFDYWWELY